MKAAMITLAPGITLDEKDLSYDYVRSAGPGGQNVNKVSTAVQLRFNINGSSGLSEEVKIRLRSLAGSRLTQMGEVVIEAKRHRTQEQNRTEAEARLAALIQKALEPPKKRLPTRRTVASVRRRIESKMRRGATKRLRQAPGEIHEEN